jgi:hypothetical protein
MAYLANIGQPMAFTCSFRRNSLGAYTKQKTHTYHENSNKTYLPSTLSKIHIKSLTTNRENNLIVREAFSFTPALRNHVDQTFRVIIQSAILSRATEHQNHLKSDMDLSL